MLSGGDESCRSKHGNNNSYCQDNVINWINWDKISEEGRMQQRFTAHLTALRERFSYLFFDRYVHEAMHDNDPQILWYNNSGELMQASHWQEHHARTLGCMLVGIDPQTNQRERVLIVFHADRGALGFRLPIIAGVAQWKILLDTATQSGVPDPNNCKVVNRLNLFSCSTVVLLARQGEFAKEESTAIAQVEESI